MALYIFGAVREAEKQPFAAVSKMDRVRRKHTMDVNLSLWDCIFMDGTGFPARESVEWSHKPCEGMHMRRLKTILIFSCLSMFAAAVGWPQSSQEVLQKPAPDPDLVVPAGTLLPAVLNSYLNTKNTQVGDIFYADTTYPIYIQQRLIIPRGSIIKGTVTEVSKPGAVKGKGRIAVRFDTILLPNGVERALVANFHGIHGPGSEKIDRKTETVEQGGSSSKGQELGTVVGTAGEGAIIGSVASGSGSGAGIGAGAGAAAGLAIVLLSRDRNLILEPGVQLDLELRQPLRFAYGEVMFTQAEIDRTIRTPVTRAKPKSNSSRGFPGIFFPRIWR
jgi:type IV secretion system protein VirB10